MASTEQLLELVYAYPILYDVKDKENKNTAKKDRVWQKISEEMETPGDELRKKWKNLRDTYSKHLKTIKKTSQSKKNYTPWRWALAMERFKPFLSFSQNLPNDCETMANSHDNRKNMQAIVADGTNEMEKIHQNNLVDQLDDEEEASGSTINYEYDLNEQKKRKKEAEKLSNTVKVVKYLERRNTKRQNFDAIDHLMISYAATIKQFSARGQVKVKTILAKAIADQELEEIELLERQQSIF